MNFGCSRSLLCLQPCIQARSGTTNTNVRDRVAFSGYVIIIVDTVLGEITWCCLPIYSEARNRGSCQIKHMFQTYLVVIAPEDTDLYSSSVPNARLPFMGNKILDSYCFQKPTCRIIHDYRTSCKPFRCLMTWSFITR